MLSLHLPTGGAPKYQQTTPMEAASNVNVTLPVKGQKRKLNAVSQPPPRGVDAAVNPVDFVLAAFLEHGLDAKNNSSAIQPHFVKPTQEMIEAYKMDVVKAARAGNLEELRRFHSLGMSLECCNRFGESLIHMICRRGELEIVRFLVEEAGVSLLARDDYGRTPLHDACWTSKPRFELVKYIVEKQPELLCVKDVRGHMPLNYVRKEHWGGWCKFLAENKGLLIPRCMRRSGETAKRVKTA